MSAPRFTGTLHTWHDARGFGFIEPTHGGQALFVHFRDLPAGSGRPRPGLWLSFTVETAADGRKRARQVQFAPQARQPVAPRRAGRERPARWTLPRQLALPLHAVLCAALAWGWGAMGPVLAAQAALSLLTAGVYVADKHAAATGRWRVAEAHLHALALLGGWPGALLGQQLARHKVAKPGFVAVFWATVVLNEVALVVWRTGLGAR